MSDSRRKFADVLAYFKNFQHGRWQKFAQKTHANAYVNTPYVEPVEFSPQRYSLEALSPPLALTAAFWPHLPTLAVYFIIMMDEVVKVPVML